MKRSLKLWLGLPAALVLALYLLLAIIGGGWADKEPLPETVEQMARPLLIVHRGVTGNFPENSMAAIDQTVQSGFHALEIDLQYSADSQFFLFHDYNTARLTGLEGVASEMTVAELADCRLRTANGYTEERIPTLAEVIERHGDSLLYYFDMKRHGHHSVVDLADDIAAFIDEHDLHDNAMVASAHFGFITYLEYNHPEVMTVLEGIDPDATWLLSLLPRDFRTDFIASRHATATDEFVDWLSESGMKKRYIAYHVDETELSDSANWEIEMLMIDHKHTGRGIGAPEQRPNEVDSAAGES